MVRIRVYPATQEHGGLPPGIQAELNPHPVHQAHEQERGGLRQQLPGGQERLSGGGGEEGERVLGEVRGGGEQVLLHSLARPSS